MKFTYLTLFPNLIQNYLEDALLKKASDKKILEFKTIQLRDYSDNKYKSVDDTPYGGGDGMILRPDLADLAFKAIYNETNYNSDKTLRIYLSPQGETLNQELVQKLLKYDHLVLLCGRYGGIDQRIINQHIDLEVSLGDFVLSGGELAALTLTESVSRFVPGVVGDQVSVEQDSFHHGLLEAPQFTKPQDWQKESVPSVLTSGHHEKIEYWKTHMAVIITWKKRKDLFQIFTRGLRKKTIEKDSQFLKAHLDFLDQLTEPELKSVGLSMQDLKKYRTGLKNI